LSKKRTFYCPLCGRRVWFATDARLPPAGELVENCYKYNNQSYNPKHQAAHDIVLDRADLGKIVTYVEKVAQEQ